MNLFSANKRIYVLYFGLLVALAVIGVTATLQYYFRTSGYATSIFTCQNNPLKLNETPEMPNEFDRSNYILVNETFGNFFVQSSEQKLTRKETILTTLRFMLEERDQYDEELVAFVRSLIVNPPPKSVKLNLASPTKSDQSQIGQSAYMDGVMGSKRNGFFIEAGAFDGETYSNTLFFELERNWTGILIEAVPSLYNQLLTKNRQVYALNACLFEKVRVAKFRVAGTISGLLSEMTEDHKAWINKDLPLAEYMYVPCFSINTILKALGDVKQVGHFTLDIEGGEWAVIRSLDLDKFNYETFTIEHSNPETTTPITKHLTARGFKVEQVTGTDIHLSKMHAV